MTIETRGTVRPRLRKKGGIWWCSDFLTCGSGPSMKDAYRDYRSRRHLIENMHRNEVMNPSLHNPRERHGGYYGEHGST